MFSLRPPRSAPNALPVGATTFVAAVTPALVVGSATLAGHGTDPAFVLEEMAFTAYYPADLSRPGSRPKQRKGLDWLIRPVGATLRGYSRFSGVPTWLLWPVVYLFGSVLNIPVHPNVPLLSPENEKQWPLVIFSHGLGGSRTAYSQLCTEMAAAGKVVLAIEHRDGTAPACTIGARTLLYYRDEDVVFPEQDQTQPRVLPLRADQLVFRQHEIYRTYAAFRALVREGEVLEALDGAEKGLQSWLPVREGAALVNCDDIALVGHSFGGCTLLSVLSSAPPSTAYAAIPVDKVVLYDPWLEPLPSPGPTPKTSFSESSTLATGVLSLKPNNRPPEKMLVINSQVFTLWKDHFARLTDIVNDWVPNGRRLLTLIGSQHHSFSDFPVLPLIRTKSAAKLMDLTALLTLAFLDDTLDTALERVPTKPMEEKIIGKRKDGRPKRTLVGEVGDAKIIVDSNTAAINTALNVFHNLNLMSKPAKADPALDPVVSLLKSIGLSQAKAVEAVKSPKIAAELKDIIETSGLHTRTEKLDDKQASLVVALAGQLVKSDPIAEEARAYIVQRIVDARLKTVDQVTASVKYVETHPTPIDDADFDKNCGVGFSITPEELYEQIAKFTTDAAIAGWSSLGQAMSGVRTIPALRWANTLEIKNTVEKVFNDKFGAKEAAKPKGKEPKKAAPTKAAASTDDAPRKSVFEEGFLGSLHKPGENPQIRPELRERHLAFTGGKVFTRFPPEPNGYLHIGHSKAIFVDFGYAAHHGGKTYLRYDDTNPEKEEAQYFESILEMVRWLGFEPWKITYSSDYFQQLYELAVELIKRDKAYVCHCTQEEIKTSRGEKSGQLPKACVHRTRPVSESLAEFEKMKDGFYRPKEANLRMKQDLEDGNPQMWDLTAYRVLETPHHRTHDKWKIYPTYDYTHCLVDSFENISHSLCTTEFVASRQSYEWLCDALEVYKPRQSEFGRLNLEGTVMSKRKIHALVQKGYVSGWDDPRLYTLIALRRRGVPPGAIRSFVSTLGVSTATSSIELARFEQTVRSYLEGTAPRLLMVLRPLKVTIENLPEDYLLMVEKPLHPKVAALGTTTIPFTRTIYIDADDFRLEDSDDYYRLAPGKTVGLFQGPHPITCTSYKTDPASGQVIELICHMEDLAKVKKPKAFIQWVAEHAPSGSPVRVDETRIFHKLFKSDQPSSDFLDDVDPDSLEVVRGAMVETGFFSLAKRALNEARREGKERTEKALKDSAQAAVTSPEDDTPRATSAQLVGNECIRFQGLRVAYFTVDKDARLACLDEADGVDPVRKQGDYVVLNRIVSLKEDSGKAA